MKFSVNAKKKLTQQEIAKQLGISPTAVSLTLKDPQTNRVSPERRQTILDFVREHAPSRFPIHSRKRVALFLPNINAYSGPVYGAITSGIQEACRRKNWKLDIQMGQDAGESDILHGSESPVGVIVVLGRKRFTGLKDPGKPIPVVLVNGESLQNPSDVVDLDSRAGVELLLQLLYDQGHRHFVFLRDHNGEDRFRHHLRQRAEAFLGFLMAHKLNFTNQNFVNVGDHGPTGEAPAYDNTLRAILQYSPRPTAVVCFNDFVAVQFIHSVQRAGLAVPGDFTVTGYDDHAMALQTSPHVTTVKHDRTQMGRTAVDVLELRLDRPQSPRVRIIAPPALIPRHSHAPVRR